MHPPLLLSELRAAANPQELLQTEFEFVNETERDAVVRFDGAGCACYEVTGPQGALRRGESTRIPAGGIWPVAIGVAAPTSAGEREYNARFVWVRSSQEETPLPLSLTLPTYADASATPDVLTIGYRPGEPTPATRLEVLRTARGRETAANSPRTLSAPESVTLGEWREIEIRQIDSGLWQARFATEAAAALPDDFRDELSGTIVVGIGDDVPPLMVSVLLQPRVGIRSPGRIQLGLLTPGTPRRRRVLLSAADGLEFRITGLEPSDSRVTVESLTADAAARHWLMLEALISDDAPLDAVLVCRTDHPDSPRIEFEITGRAVDDGPSSAATAVSPNPQELP